MSLFIELIWWWSDTSNNFCLFFVKQGFYIEQVGKHLVIIYLDQYTPYFSMFIVEYSTFKFIKNKTKY